MSKKLQFRRLQSKPSHHHAAYFLQLLSATRSSWQWLAHFLLEGGDVTLIAVRDIYTLI